MLTALCAALPAAHGAEPPWSVDDLRRFLHLAGEGLTPNDWKVADQGGIAVKMPPPASPREVLVLGLTKVKANTRCFLSQFEDIEKFMKNPAVLNVRKIGTPPRAADLAAIRLTPGEVAGLKICRLGDCSLKLPVQAMNRIVGEVNWDASIAHELAESAFRGWLADYLRAYGERGNVALVEYQSSPVSVRLGGELQEMFDANPRLGVLVPEFYEYLTSYPKAHASGVRDFLYWSTANFGFKPVTSVSHVTIFQQPGQGVIVSKQIYANHYFDASMGLTFLVDLSADGKPAMYLVYLNRSRIDLLSGWRAGVRKFILRRRLIGGFKDNLRDVSDRVGAACNSDAGNAR